MSTIFSRSADSTGGLLRSFAGSVDRHYDRLRDKRICLGVTGLSGSGKSTFLTSLIYQLINFHTASLPSFTPIFQDRLLGAKLHSLVDESVTLFDYQGGIDRLSANPPSWPASTTDISSCLLELRYKRKKGLLQLPGNATQRLFVEIRDYPGEWLLDLPLLNMSFHAWSVECENLFQKSPRAELMGNLLPLLHSINPMSTADEQKINAIHLHYIEYLQRCKTAGLSLIQPGRFLMPDSSGAVIEPFFPVLTAGNYQADALAKAKPNSYFSVLRHHYELYLEQQVKPFYQNYFSDINRQLILVDVLKALHGGKHCLEDMRISLARILDSFRYGQNSIISRLFAPKVEKVVFAASKIDQVLPEQHENVRGLIAVLVSEAYKEAHFQQTDSFTEVVSAVRATERILYHDRPLLKGTDTEGQSGGLSHPEIPNHLPDDADWQRFADWRLRRLMPPANPALASGGELPHIRMDTVLRELIGDKF